MVRDIVEGSGSSVVFVVGTGTPVSVRDFVDYCKSVRMTVGDAKSRIVEVKFFTSMFGISQMDVSEDGNFVIKY